MSGVIFTRGVVTGLGAAAGTLAVAALLGTAPIANADNNGNEIDWSTLGQPRRHLRIDVLKRLHTRFGQHGGYLDHHFHR